MSTKNILWTTILTFIAFSIFVVVVVKTIKWSENKHKIVNKFVLPDPDELYHVRNGDTIVVYESHQVLHVEFYHSFRRHVCGEKLYIYSDE